jgi:hypothetical protein
LKRRRFILKRRLFLIHSHRIHGKNGLLRLPRKGSTMRRIALLPFALLSACTNAPGVSGDKVTLCERSPLCSAHPLPDGQNGVE